MSFGFVRSAHVIPRKRGRGTVDIMVDVGSSDTGRLSEISDAVASQREIGVDAAVSQAEAKSVSVSVSLTAASGFIPEQVEEAAQAALEDFGGRLGVSQPLKLIDLYTCLIHIQGVDNFQVTAPDSDVIPTETQVIRPTFTVTAKGGEDLNSLTSMENALRPLVLYNLGEDSFISRELSCYGQFLDEVREAIDSLLTEGFLQTAGEEGIARMEALAGARQPEEMELETTAGDASLPLCPPAHDFNREGILRGLAALGLTAQITEDFGGGAAHPER